MQQKHHPLTREQQRLVLQAELTCRRVANRYAGRMLAFDDALQVARLAACMAVRAYDAAKGPWRGYVQFAVRHAVREALRNARLVRVPRSASERGVVAPHRNDLEAARAVASSDAPADTLIAVRESVADVASRVGPGRVGRILVARSEGWSLADIGRAYGLTKQRIHAIIKRTLRVDVRAQKATA